MSHSTLKTAALCFTFALLAGGAANAMQLAAPHGATGLAVEVAQRGYAANRTYDYQGQQTYGYDANGRPYGHEDDEMHALQYMFPQTYGWPRGTENQF